jgi:hypothetical protein
MEQIQRAVCKNCFDQLREQLSRLIVLYGGNPSGDAGPGHTEPPESPRPQGLCRSCVRRADCTKQAVDGGVWHCADYA